MYLRHYGLRDKPFKLAHDPAYYYAASHQIPLNELSYSVEERQGLATLIGEPGTGKTTLLRRLLQNFAPHQRGIFMSDASLGGQSLMRHLEAAAGVVTGTVQERSRSLKNLLARASNTTVVLLIDEAQAFTAEQLEEIRRLTNLEVPGRKLLEIILAGQPSLEHVLATPELAALNQRVAVRCRLDPLDLEHTRAYMEHRLRVARARDVSLFAPEAVKLIHEKSRGIPRLINIICERCLVAGYADDVQIIHEAKVREAVSDLKLELEKKPAVPPMAQTMGNGLLMKMGSRIEAIEEKLDILMQMLIRAGIARPEPAENTRIRRYVENLKRTPQASGTRPQPLRATERPPAKTLPETQALERPTKE